MVMSVVMKMNVWVFGADSVLCLCGFLDLFGADGELCLHGGLISG